MFSVCACLDGAESHQSSKNVGFGNLQWLPNGPRRQQIRVENCRRVEENPWNQSVTVLQRCRRDEWGHRRRSRFRFLIKGFFLGSPNKGVCRVWKYHIRVICESFESHEIQQHIRVIENHVSVIQYSIMSESLHWNEIVHKKTTIVKCVKRESCENHLRVMRTSY